MKIRKIIRTYLIMTTGMILAQSFFFAIYQIFLVDQGLSLLQINLINFAFMLANFLLEIPTGAYADIFGRRLSVAWGCFILGLSFLFYFLFTGFWWFVVAEIIGALGLTFISGALEAWMVDALKHEGHEGDLEKIYQKEGLPKLIGVMVGSLAGAYIGSLDLTYPWLCSALGMVLIGVYAFFNLREDYFFPQKFSWNLKPIKKVALDSVHYGLHHRSLFYVISFGALLFLSFQAFNMQWPILFRAEGLSLAELGWLFNGIAITSYLGNLLVPKITQWLVGEKKALILSQLITAIGMLLTSLVSGLYPLLIWFFVHEVGRGTFRPLKQAYLNRRIASDKRATLLSFDAMVNQLGCALGLLLSGWLANSFSIQVAWFVSALIALASVIIFYRLKNGD